MTTIVCVLVAFVILLFSFSTFDYYGDANTKKARENPYYFDSMFCATYENGKSEVIKMHKRDYGALFRLVENRALWLDTRVLNIHDVARDVTIQ